MSWDRVIGDRKTKERARQLDRWKLLLKKRKKKPIEYHSFASSITELWLSTFDRELSSCRYTSHPSSLFFFDIVLDSSMAWCLLTAWCPSNPSHPPIVLFDVSQKARCSSGFLKDGTFGRRGHPLGCTHSPNQSKSIGTFWNAKGKERMGMTDAICPMFVSWRSWMDCYQRLHAVWLPNGWERWNIGEKGTLDYPLIKETLGWYDKRVSIKCYFLGGSIFCKIRRFHQREDPGNEETGQKWLEDAINKRKERKWMDWKETGFILLQ